MSKGKVVLYTIIGVVAFFGLYIILGLAGIYSIGFLDSRREEVRREVWENTSSHIHAVTEQLGRYKSQYELASSDEDKVIIKNAVKGQFGYLDEDVIEELPYALQTFLRMCRGY